MTYLEAFKAKAQELLPQHDELQEIDLTAFTCEPKDIRPDDVEDYMRITHGEYLDGMATALNAMIQAEAYKA